MDTMQRGFAPQLAVLGQIFQQGSQGRSQAINEFMQFYDRQFRSDTQNQADTNQAMALMLNALGITTTPISQPNTAIPPGAPGFAENVGSLASTYLPWMMN